MLFFSFCFLLVFAPFAVGVSVPSADRGFDVVVRCSDPDGVRTSAAFGYPYVMHRGSDDAGVWFDAWLPRAAVGAWTGPMPFPGMRCDVFHGLPSVMTTARMPSEVLFVWWRRSQSMTCSPMPPVFQDRVDRTQPDQIQWAVQRDIHAGERDASTADQVGGIPIPPRHMRLDRHGRPPIQAPRTAAHRSIMAATVITMLPSGACGTTCSR